MGTEQEQVREPGYAWVVAVTAAVLVGTGNGALNAMGVFLKPVADDLGWQRGETAFAYLAGISAMGVAGIVTGHLSDRWSVRPIATWGAAAVGGACLLLSTQQAPWQFYLYYMLLGGLGSAALFTPLLTLVGRWFVENRGLAQGLVAAGQALGGGLLPFALRYVITLGGWRTAYAVLGGAVLAVALPLTLLVRPAPGWEPPPTFAASAGTPLRHLPGLPVAWMGLAALFTFFCRGTALVHLVALAQDRGIGAQEGATALLALSVGAIVARLLFGRIADRIGSIRAWVACNVLMAATAFAFPFAGTAATLTLLGLAFGMADGAPPAILATLRIFVPDRQLGLSTGVVIFCGVLGMGLGGWQGGIAFDLTGDYRWVFGVASLATLLSAVLVAGLGPYARARRAAAAR